ncbi:MAG: hypothetical protein GY782_00325 [Gammaproteobacteria bacterium]|nr:hypothetical protein [Gammaproteobacteria bacterium]
MPTRQKSVITLNMKQLFTNLNRHDLILTGNKRLSRCLQRDYDHWQQSQGNDVWPSLNVIHFDSWLISCWQQALAKGATAAKILLQEAQAQLLWEQIIATSQSSGLLNINATAKEARAAWRLLQQWQLSLEDSRLRESDESRRFVNWAQQFAHQYDDFIVPAALPAIVTTLINQRHIDLPARITLLGFLDITPNQQQLLDTLQQQGVEITIKTRYHDDNSAATIRQATLTTTEDEIIAMLSWAKSTLANDPEATIACIVPQLNQQRATVARHCRKLFGENGVNMSSGILFSTEPLIASAITILQLARSKIPFDDISLLLRSPFIGGSEKERQQRALLDLQWRKQNRGHLSLTDLIQSRDGRSCPLLKTQFSAYPLPAQQQSPAEWAELFCQQLSALGWPGERSLNSREYQALSQWQTLLSQFAQLSLIKPHMCHSEALSQLINMAAATLFQHQTEDSAIQVLGLLEATGLPFSHIWLMGLDDIHWPEPAKPNALLPCRLQRTLNMPHASANRELTFAKTVMQALIHHSDEIIFSSPQQAQDQTLSPSALLSDFDQHLPPVQKPSAPATLQLEQLQDWQAPAIAADETVGGGTALFKAQAQCPFRAFANYRLRTQPLERITPGLNPRQRGILLHKILELFWHKISSHAELCALDDEALVALLSELIQQAITEQFSHHGLTKRFLELEKTRLLALMKLWLDVEKARPPFTVIAREQWQKIAVKNIAVTIQIDRIDQLADGQQIIIDYKSGASCSVKSWFGERPDDPQLPLYAATQKKKPAAIYFSQVYRNKLRMVGIADKGVQLPGTIPLAKLVESYPGAQGDWRVQCDYWQKIVFELAEQFSRGEARVDPKNGEATCRACFCQLAPLCRINEH